MCADWIIVHESNPDVGKNHRYSCASHLGEQLADFAASEGAKSVRVAPFALPPEQPDADPTDLTELSGLIPGRNRVGVMDDTGGS